MSSDTIKRRSALQPGSAPQEPILLAANEVLAENYQKRSGETKIVAVMGDYWHNGMAQEMDIREIFSSKSDFRIIFVRSSRFFTPELLKDADLLITSRYSGPDSLGWSPEGLVDSLIQGDELWTDENVKAIIDNVNVRGMGFLALHCTTMCDRNDLVDFMDVVPVMHHQTQPLWVDRVNQQHPITKGIGNFFIDLDEQFAVVIKSKTTTTLFESKAVHDKRDAISGWCLERGRGRVVGLLPGHTQSAYRVPEYQEILWRSAHWAMKRDIPSYPG